MRTRFYVTGLIILLLALSVSIYSQQTGAARRSATNAANAPASAGARSSANSRVSSAIVRSDVSEALSVIQETTSMARSSTTTRSSNHRLVAC